MSMRMFQDMSTEQIKQEVLESPHSTEAMRKVAISVLRHRGVKVEVAGPGVWAIGPLGEIVFHPSVLSYRKLHGFSV